MNESAFSGRGSQNLKDDQSSVSISLAKKQFNGRYAISAQEFNSDMVGLINYLHHTSCSLSVLRLDLEL